MSDDEMLLHSEAGEGHIEAEGLGLGSLPVSYVVSVSVSVLPGGGRGVKRIRGRAVPGDEFGLFPFVQAGAPAVLILRDGGRWECYVQSTDGTLVNRGGHPWAEL